MIYLRQSKAQKMKNIFLRLIFVTLPFSLMSCGGGGSDSPDSGGDKPQVSKEYINVTPSVELLAEGQSQEISVSANCQWTVSKPSDASWLTVAPSSGSNSQTITVTASRNSSASSRKASLTISGTSRSVSVAVTQSGQEVQLSVDKSSLNFTAKGGSASFNLTCNSNWTISTPYWCTPSQKQGSGNASITLTVSPNNITAERKDDIKVASSWKTLTIAVTQAMADRPSLSDLNVTNISATTADCTFSISSDLAISACGICYSSTSESPTVNDSTVNVTTPQSGSNSVSLSRLLPKTKYNIRAYATSVAGTSYSKVATITTQKQKPSEGDNPTPAKRKIKEYVYIK